MRFRMKALRLQMLCAGVLVILIGIACQPQVVEPEQVEVTREVIVTQQVQEEVEVTRQVEVQVEVTPTPESEAEFPPIKIGLSSALSGALADLGDRYAKGMTMAIEDLGGEIMGRPLELYTADNKCNPTDAVTAVQQLIDVDQVHVILGSGCSGATLGSLPIILEGETPQLTVASSNPTIYDELGVGGNEWGFRINPDDQIMAETFSPYIAEDAETIFTLAENTDFGRGAIDRYLVELPEAGVEVLGSEFFDLGASDVRPVLTRVKSLDPDAILIVTTEQLGSVILRQIREVDIDAKIFSRGSLTTPLMLELTADNPSIPEGVIEASFWAAGVDRPTEAQFEERWDIPVSAHPMLAYYGVRYVLAPAIECAISETGEVTRGAIRDCLEETSVDTPVGHVDFDDHNQSYINMTLSTIVDGNIVLLDTIPSEKRSE